MRIISKIKTTFKKAYKSVKTKINKFLKKLGFKKTEDTKISTKIFDDMDEILDSYVTSGINNEIDLEALEPISI